MLLSNDSWNNSQVTTPDYLFANWNQESGIRKSLFSTQQKHLYKLTVLVYKKTYSIFQVSKQYVTIIRSKKTIQNKIYLIGSCINRRNTQQNYVNLVMTNVNKPVIRHINAPVHNILIQWGLHELNQKKRHRGWHLSESSTNKKFWNWICNPLEFYSYGYRSMSIDSIVQEPIWR